VVGDGQGNEVDQPTPQLTAHFSAEALGIGRVKILGEIAPAVRDHFGQPGHLLLGQVRENVETRG
jgi:hypothetical protein